MRSALDVMRDSVESWTMSYGEYQYPRYTIEACGPKFMEFVEWLKHIPYQKCKCESVKEEEKDEGISW